MKTCGIHAVALCQETKETINFGILDRKDVDIRTKKICGGVLPYVNCSGIKTANIGKEAEMQVSLNDTCGRGKTGGNWISHSMCKNKKYGNVTKLSGGNTRKNQVTLGGLR